MRTLGWLFFLGLGSLAGPGSAFHGETEWDGPRGQYRGPTDEVLFATSLGGAGAAHPLADPAVAFEGFNRWEFWFEINKDILLRSPHRQRRPAITPRPNTKEHEPGGRIEFSDVEQVLLPMLSDIARSTQDDEIRSAALLGLARLGSRSSLEVLEEALVSERMVDRRYAILGLGMIDTPRSMLRLLTIFKNPKQPADLRAYAAIGMGLQGRREVIRVLVSHLRETFSAQSSLGKEEAVSVGAITALGLGEPSTRKISVSFLVESYERLSRYKSRSRRLMTAILASLGKLQDAAALPTILEALRDSDVEIRRSAALAAGELGSAAAVSALVEILGHGGDEQTKGFVCIALGQIATPRAIDVLREHVRSRRSRTVQSFSALGLGLARDRYSAEVLRELLAMPSEENLRGSFAIALGMLHDQEAAPKLFEILEDRGADPDLRGYAAIALGMIRPEKGHERLLGFLREDRDRVEDVFRGVLLGLGLWEDEAAVKDLVELIRSDRRDMVRGHAVQALNMIRARKAIAPLGELARPTRGRVSFRTRMYAVTALGALGEKMNYPLYAETFYATNYRMRSPLLQDLMQYL